MEDIAAQAEVSVPTVYNYFASKRDVLIDFLMQDRRDTQTAYESVVSNPPDEPADAFALLIYTNMAAIRSPEHKRLWRDVIAAVANAHDREQDQFEQNHEIFKGYIKKLLRHFIAAGKLSAEIPLSLAADVIFAINSSNLRCLVASEHRTPEDVRDLTRRQMTLVMADWSAGESRPVALVARQIKSPRKQRPRQRVAKAVKATSSSEYQEAK